MFDEERVFDEEQLRRMSREDRLRLLRALVALDRPGAAVERIGARRRLVALALIIVCCVVLAAWIGVLAVTLPRYYRAGGWRGAWLGFDGALLATFLVTGWAAWRRRQVLLICLIVLATLLCCDAWFDVVLDVHTKGFAVSLLSALVVELPLAALAITGARRLLRMSVGVIRRYEGHAGPVPSLRHVRLIGGGPGQPLSEVFREPGADEAAGGAAAAPGQPRAGQGPAGPGG